MNVSRCHRITAPQIAMEARDKSRERLIKYLPPQRCRSCLSPGESGTVWEEWYVHTSSLKYQREKGALPYVKQEAREDQSALGKKRTPTPNMLSEVKI